MGSMGPLGGTLLSWNPLVDGHNPFHTVVGIIEEGNLRCLKKRIRILNVYGPYQNMRLFLDCIANDGFLNDSSLIMVGDLNLTMSIEET